MFKITKDHKIPYVNRMIPAGTKVAIVGRFYTQLDRDKFKVRISSVPKGKYPIPVVDVDDVYAIESSLLD